MEKNPEAIGLDRKMKELRQRRAILVSKGYYVNVLDCGILSDPGNSKGPYSDSVYNLVASKILYSAYHRDLANNVHKNGNHKENPQFPLAYAIAWYTKRNAEVLFGDEYREYAKKHHPSEQEMRELADNFLKEQKKEFEDWQKALTNSKQESQASQALPDLL